MHLRLLRPRLNVSNFQNQPTPVSAPAQHLDGDRMAKASEKGTKGDLSESTPLLQLDPEQQGAAVQMTHLLNMVVCMVSEHFTSLERYFSIGDLPSREDCALEPLSFP